MVTAGRKGWVAACALTVALSLSALAGCSGATVPASSGGASAGPVTITFSYLWSGAEAESLEKIIATFNSSQDQIIVKGVSNPDFQKQLTSMSSKTGSFDISDHFGSSVAAWASKGILEPLGPYIERDGYDTSDYIGSVMDQMTYDGQVYSMPIAVHTQMLMYNKTLLAQAGLDGPPETTEEWATYIAKLTKVKANGDITQLGYGNIEPETDFTTLGFAFGGRWFDDNGMPTADDPGNVAGLSFYVDNVPAAYGADAVTKFQSGFGELASAQNPFYTGQLATIIEGAWEVNLINTYAPELDYGVAPLPYPESHPELKGTTTVTSSTLFIPANSQHKDEAWEFMKYLLASEQMAVFTHDTSNLPSRVSLADNSIYDDLGDKFGVWLASLKSTNLRAMIGTPWSDQYTTDRGLAFESVAKMTATPQEALAKLQESATAYAK